MGKRRSAHERFAAWVAKFKTLDEAGKLLDLSTAYVSLLVNKQRTPERYDVRMKIAKVAGIPAAEWDK